MHVTVSSIDRVIASGSPYVRVEGSSVTFTLVLTVEEGAACRFGAGQWNDPALDDIAPGLIAELGWKEIEHAAGRTVVLRCQVPAGNTLEALCAADSGRGFEPVVVVKD